MPHQQSKKIKTHVENVSALILKRKLRLLQVVRIDPTEIVIPFTTNAEIPSLWAENEYWQRACSNFLREISNNYSKEIQETSVCKENLLDPASHCMRNNNFWKHFILY